MIGAAGTGAALAAIPPTVGGGLVCTALTATLCALPSGAAVTIEAVVAAGGIVVAGHGAATMAYMKNNPVDGGPWGSGSGQPRIINGYKVRIDWESPGMNGNVHVTIGKEKIYVTDPSDLSALPKVVRENS